MRPICTKRSKKGLAKRPNNRIICKVNLMQSLGVLSCSEKVLLREIKKSKPLKKHGQRMNKGDYYCAAIIKEGGDWQMVRYIHDEDTYRASNDTAFQVRPADIFKLNPNKIPMVANGLFTDFSVPCEDGKGYWVKLTEHGNWFVAYYHKESSRYYIDDNEMGFTLAELWQISLKPIGTPQ